MIDNTEQKLRNIIHSSKKESLLPSEKEVIKSNLLHFIKQNPIKEKREFFHWPAVFMSMANAPTVRYVSLVAMVLVVGGGSVAFAAQNSQPG